MTEYIAHTETRDGVRLQVIADADATDPRKEFDNAGTMVCDHGRYNLGDEDGHRLARASIIFSRDYKQAWNDEDLTHGPTLWRLIQECSDIVALPLYLYDHSGITMSTSKFWCSWDSGQVGFIFIDRTTILNEWGGKLLTPAKRAQAEKYLTGEVETYDQYLTGDVYGCVVTKLDPDADPDDEDADGEELESCWGFYGLKYAIEEGQRMAGWEG